MAESILILNKIGAQKWLSITTVLWGVLSALTGLVQTETQFIVLRFLLGLGEAGFYPGILLLASIYFPNKVRASVVGIFVLGVPLALTLGSPISGALLEMHGFLGKPGWFWMFFIEGIPAVIWAFCWVILVRDKPADAGWLSEQEKQALQQAMDREQRDIKPMRNYGEAMRSRSVIMLCAVHALWSIGVYGFMMWMPSILKNAAQMDIVAVGWLAAVPYLAAICLMLTVSWLSDKYQNRKLFIWPLLLIAAIAFFASWMLGNQSFWLSYALLVVAAACMYAPYGPFFALIPELLPRNVSGVSMGMINSFGALGAFLGAWLVGYLNGVTGGPGVSYTFMAIALLSSVVLMYCVRAQNETTSPSAEMVTR